MLPDRSQETVDSDRLKWMIESGTIDPDCAYCQRTFLAAENPASVMAPSHRASAGCKSGSRPHCTCDACF